MTPHMVVDTSLDFSHGSGAQFGETAGPSRPQIHKGSSARESACVRDCAGTCSQSHSECDFGECVVAIHVPPLINNSTELTRIDVDTMSRMSTKLGSEFEPGDETT